MYFLNLRFCRMLPTATYHAIRTLWDRYWKVGALMENDYGLHKIL